LSPWTEFHSNYARARQGRGRCGALVGALDLMLYDRCLVWAEMRALYLLAHMAERSRWRALLFVFKAYWEPAPPDHLALARAAVERRDWSTAAAELRLWEPWDWEDNAEQQRNALRAAALAFERGDLPAARDHYVQALKLKGWGDRDTLSEMLTREIEEPTKA